MKSAEDCVRTVRSSLNDLISCHHSEIAKIDRDVVSKSIDQIKNMVIDADTINMVATNLSTQNAEVAQLLRELYEYSIFASIYVERLCDFCFFYSLLKVFYFDLHNESDRMYEVVSLYLQYLLSCYRMAEFQTELQSLNFNAINTDNHLIFACLLDRYLMEGSYNKRNWKLSDDGYIYLAKVSDDNEFKIGPSSCLIGTESSEGTEDESALGIAGELIGCAVELEAII
ncbi:hypothetical protein ACOME3_003450 [Neoechinorhynchus agilis]